MKRAALSAFVTWLLFATVGPASAATGTETIVLDVGDYGVVQLPPGIDGASWLALCGAPAGSELRWSTVHMRAFFSEIAGDKPGQKSGRKVSASGCKAPRVLVSDLALRAGKVRDAKVKGDDISMGDLRARLVASPAKDESKTPARLLLEGAKGRLVLIEDPESATVTYKLRWAGDLDGDGGLDLVIEEEADGVRVYLFLSRDKPANGSWPPAAITFHGGC
jgi:hypothetical protein